MDDKTKQIFEENLYIYNNDIYRIILSVINHHYTAEDLTQTVMERAWKGFSNLKSLNNSKNWLKSITRNTLKEYMRKKNEFLKHTDINYMDDKLAKYVIKTTYKDVLDNIIMKEDTERLATALKKLNPTMQNIIIDYYINRVKMNIIADEYNLKYGTTRAYCSKAKKQLKEIYRKLENDEIDTI